MDETTLNIPIKSNTVSTHRDYRDISFYEDNSKITKVNLTADIPLIQHDECLEDVYDTKRLDGYFGLYNVRQIDRNAHLRTM